MKEQINGCKPNIRPAVAVVIAVFVAIAVAVASAGADADAVTGECYWCCYWCCFPVDAAVVQFAILAILAILVASSAKQSFHWNTYSLLPVFKSKLTFPLEIFQSNRN